MSKRGENIYKRKDGRWEGRILIHAPDSKRISVYGKTYREVRDRMQEKKLLPGIVHCPKRVSEAAEVWLASRERLLKPSSVAKYRNLVQRHILPLLGKLRICDLDRNTVSGFVRALSCGQTGSGVQLTRKTVRDVLMILEKSVRFAGELSFSVEKNELSGKTGGGKRITVLSEQEQKRLEEQLLTDTDEKKLGLLLCLYAGLRIGEICAMRWECIDLCEKTLSVNVTMQRLQIAGAATGQRTGVIESSPKSEDSRRTVPIADFLIEPLLKRKPRLQSAYLLTGSEQYIEPRSYENYYKRVLSAAGIPICNFHTLRHTFATRCIESGADAKTVSVLLGHSTVRMTLDRYVHPTMNAKQASINRMAMSRQIDGQTSEAGQNPGSDRRKPRFS
ncbi:MAG: tyrosine-type recombinase/integrase [Eubacteriales bacterium]|nr:tyrosine-type recombinase/integrase [Eubacteriales bacterium]